MVTDTSLASKGAEGPHMLPLIMTRTTAIQLSPANSVNNKSAYTVCIYIVINALDYSCDSTDVAWCSLL